MTSRNVGKNPNNVVEKVRITGTYTSVQAAKDAAHRSLYEAGYEREWFKEYVVEQEGLQHPHVPKRTGLAVFAIASDGTEFCVSIATTPNHDCLTSPYDDRRVPIPLYHVIQADVAYSDDEGSKVRDVNVQGVFKTYDEARRFAETVLLSEEDGIGKESYIQYDEAAPNERDCGYGENVILHAISDYGVNYLISVIKTEALESERLAEAAMRIR